MFFFCVWLHWINLAALKRFIFFIFLTFQPPLWDKKQTSLNPWFSSSFFWSMFILQFRLSSCLKLYLTRVDVCTCMGVHYACGYVLKCFVCVWGGGGGGGGGSTWIYVHVKSNNPLTVFFVSCYCNVIIPRNCDNWYHAAYCLFASHFVLKLCNRSLIDLRLHKLSCTIAL